MQLDQIPPIALVLALLAIVAVGLLFVRPAAAPRGALPYRRKSLLSPWERRALPQLLRQLPPGCHLCPQVRLADLLAVTAREPSARQTALNRVARKSVDFVVVDVASGDAIFVVELDDRSHARPDRQARDALVNDALRAADIPIVRFRPGQPLVIGHHLRGSAQPRFEVAETVGRPRLA